MPDTGRPLEQVWDELTAYVEKIFFTRLTDEIARASDQIGIQLQTDIETGLNRFFPELASMMNGWEEEPQWVYDNDGFWGPLNSEYLQFKNGSVKRGSDMRNNYFLLSELPRPPRNSKQSRRLRRKTFATKKELAKNPSLRMKIRSLGNPSQYYGKVVVTIESHTKINRGGRRQYKAGTFVDGVNRGGNTVRFNSDYVTLTVKWLPALDGLDVLMRGVTEDPRNSGSSVANLTPLPGDVQTKLLNHEFNEFGRAYRPLLGPYMLWYQDTQVREMIRKSIAKYGPTT